MKRCIAIAVLCAGITLPVAAADWPAYPGSPAGPGSFIQADGTLLRTADGKEFLIRSVAFGNEVWSRPKSPDKITHHSAIDYQRVKAMGFNSIRFYLNYDLFEDDSAPYVYKQAGFDWLDKNIAAARTNGVYLLLNMHIPQGGFQSLGEGTVLWTDGANRKRLVALWTEIAKRYRNEEIILGYAPINEPVTVQGVAELGSMYQDIINGIRTVDPSHLVFVERVNWLRNASEFSADDAKNCYFPLNLKDPGSPAKPNIVYEFHMYDPMEFTHQNASWVPSNAGKFTNWPDESRIAASNSQWAGCSDSKALAKGTTPWTDQPGTIYTVKNPAFKVAYPTVQIANLGTGGEVWVDDVVVEEYDSTGALVRTMVNDPVDKDAGWSLWAENGVGTAKLARNVEGASNKTCMYMKGTTKEANNACSGLKFVVKQGFGYKIKGRLKGSNTGPGAVVKLRLDFFSADNISLWNKDFLSAAVGRYSAFATKQNVPVFCGEFGLYKDCFKADRGGLAWISDMIDILTAQKVNYNYHTWHESSFGLYTTDGSLPDPEKSNKAAIEFFTRKQNTQ